MAKTIFLCFLVVLFFFPYYWMIVLSLEPLDIVVKLGPHLIPERVTFENYNYLFHLKAFPRWLFNSLFTPTIASLVVCLSASMSGYVLAKRNFPGNRIIFLIMLGTMTIPGISILLPLVMLMKSLKLTNTYPSLFLPLMAWPFGIFLMKQIIKTIPNEIIESGMVDGASEWQIYWHLVLPIARPGVIILGLFTFVGCYNDFFWQLLMIRSDSMKTLPLVASTFAVRYNPKTQLLMAIAFIATIPLLILYFSFRKHFIKGATLGGVKG